MSTFQFGDQEMLCILKLNNKKTFSTIIIINCTLFCILFSFSIIISAVSTIIRYYLIFILANGSHAI